MFSESTREDYTNTIGAIAGTIIPHSQSGELEPPAKTVKWYIRANGAFRDISIC